MPDSHRLPAGEVVSDAAQLQRFGLSRPTRATAATWFDYVTTDADRLTLSWGIAASRHGAVLANYVEAAQVAGGGDVRVLVRHVLPNVITPVIVLVTLGIPAAIVAGAALSFLGLGVQPPTPDWGEMLSKGRAFMSTAWWLSTFPGLAIAIAVLSINRFGDGLRDALDPRMKL